MNITEFRNKYPEYNEVSDEELADRLWNKHYKSQGVSKEEFNKRFLGTSRAQPQVPTGSQPQVPSGAQPQAPSGPQPSWRDYARAVMATRIKQQIAPIELGLGAFDWATKKLLSKVPEEWTADQIDWLLNHGNLPPRPGEGVSERIYGPRGVLGPTTQVRKWAEEKGIDREKVRKGIGPRALASVVPSAIEFIPTLAAGAGEDVIASLGGASEGKISGSLPRPSAKRMGANFIAPYVEAIRTRSFDPILKHALEDPIQTFFDAAIAFGVVKGVFNGEMAVKTRVKVRKAWEKEIKNAAKEGGEAPGIGRLEEILVEHGVPIESVREAALLMDNIPAYKRTGIKERPSEPPPEPPSEPPPGPPPEPVPEPPSEPVPEPPIPKAPEPKPGNLLDLASKTVRPEPPSILELAQRAIVPEAKGVKKRAETRLKEVREGRKVPDMSRVKVIGGKTESAVNKIVEGALEGKKFEPKAVLVKRHGGVLPDKISKATAIVPEFGSKTEAVTYGERLARGRVSGITANNAERVIEAKKHGLKIKIGKLKKAGKMVEVVNAEQQLRRLDDVMDGIIEGRKKMKPKELKRVMGEVEKARELRKKSERGGVWGKLREERGSIPGFSSKMHEKVLDEFPKSSPIELAKKWFIGKQKKGEFSKDEIEYSGVMDWLNEHKGDKVSKDELVKYLSENAMDFDEVWRFRGPKEGQKRAKYSKYVLPGGSKYRELLVVLPKKDRLGKPVKTPHFPEKNLFAHARITDRTLPNREGKMLFVEELQSDYHKLGRNWGYKGEPGFTYKIKKTKHNHIDGGYLAVKVVSKKTGEVVGSNYYNIDKKYSSLPISEQWKRAEVSARRWADRRISEGNSFLPVMRNTWHSMMLRRIFREAADKGYKWVGWAEGKTQSERWGGEEGGMAGNLAKFYDEILVNAANKILKRFGGKVEKKTIRVPTPFSQSDFLVQMRPEFHEKYSTRSIFKIMSDTGRSYEDVIREINNKNIWGVYNAAADKMVDDIPMTFDEAMSRMKKLRKIADKKEVEIYAVRMTPELVSYMKSLRTGNPAITEGGAIGRKLREEKGAITFSRKTEVEKRYDRAMKNLRKAVYAEGRRSETAAESKEAAEAHVNGTASLRNASEFDKAIGKPPKKARKVRDKAMAEEFWVPEEHSPNSEAAITYVKSKDFKKYVEKLPEMGELKPKDVRGKAGVVDVRESGQFVHTSFARQFVDVVDKGNGQISVKVKASDIPAHWAHTLDPARVIEWSDGKFGGELAKKLLRPARDTIRARNHYIADWDSRINDIVSKYRIKSTKDRKMLGRVLLGEVKKPPKRFVEAAKAMRELYDKGLEDMNAAREKQGRKLIPRREDFGMPWVIETTFRDKLFGSKSTPDGILKKAEPPDFIRPNSPFNPRELPREAQYDRYVKEKDAIKVAMDYGRTVAKDVFNTNVIHNNKVHARFLNDIGLTNLANAIMQWTTEVFAGRKHAIDRVIEGLGPVVSGVAGVQRRLKAAKMRTLFALNIPWNVFVQTSSSAMLVPRVGFKNSVKGLDVFVSPKLRRFVEDTYTHVMKKGVRPEVAEFRGTVSEFRRLNKTGRLNSVADTLNFFTKWLEKVLTDHAIAAGYFEGKARGLKGRDLLEFASDVGAKVHSMYNFEDLPALLRSKDMTASFPLQTFYWETLNNLREIGGRRGAMAGISKKNMAVRLLKWYATMVAINALTSHFIDRNVWTPISFVPMGPHIASLLGIEVEGGRYDAFKPTAVQWLDDVRRAARNAVYYDDWTSTRKLVNEWLVPGGVAVERMMGTVEAMQQGGRVRSADKRTLFRIPKGEVGKSMMLGPWGTSEAKKLKHERDRTLIGNILGGKIPKNVKNRKLREMARERRK